MIDTILYFKKKKERKENKTTTTKIVLLTLTLNVDHNGMRKQKVLRQLSHKV